VYLPISLLNIVMKLTIKVYTNIIKLIFYIIIRYGMLKKCYIDNCNDYIMIIFNYGNHYEKE